MATSGAHRRQGNSLPLSIRELRKPAGSKNALRLKILLSLSLPPSISLPFSRPLHTGDVKERNCMYMFQVLK